jgi:hypothetical protein
MKDIKHYIEKLHADADACSAISKTATNEAKRTIFLKLTDTYRSLAEDLERLAEANAIADEERDEHLLGLLGTGENLAAPG